MKRYTLPSDGFSSKSEEKIFWQRAIKGYRGSKLSRIEFCERNGLKLSSFKRWVTQLNMELTKAAVCSEGLNFAQVKVSEAKEVSVNEKFSEAAKFEVELSSGDKVRLPLSKDVLLMTINVLKRQGC
jgi:hypothetical protein